ncbi:MAG TPA: rRNA maturation RNase YbeY [Allosphingosinicella sp.]
MIRVESDSSGEWDSSSPWAAIAERSVQAAIAASRHSALTESAIAVEVSVKFTGDEEVRSLNGSFRAKDKPTNVLSFPMLDSGLLGPLAKADGAEVLLGDVVLAHGVCASEARDKGVSVEDHAAHLIVHGTLHLLGYDHETGEEDAEAMERLERQALDSIGIADPYLSEVGS